MSFSLYFFSDDGATTTRGKYALILDATAFAEDNGFTAVWIPERHFQEFGGLHPNPSVLAAAIAARTRRIGIRAGSVALPLHHPVRAAQEWSMVDNLSNGRVAISLASGWHPDDFIFAPSDYERRKELMFENLGLIRRLWAGEEVDMSAMDGNSVPLRLLPRPVQSTLPVWITTAGSPETWARAAQIGANVFAALVGYSTSELAERVRLYRETREAHGHDPSAGVITLMVHTYIGEDEALTKELARGPMCRYLRSYFKQFEKVAPGAEQATEEDKDTLVSLAFDKYYEQSLLIGTAAKCRALINSLTDAGVDELACLIDFGLDQQLVLESLPNLAAVQQAYRLKHTHEH